jgi:AcrR family transcriptional regulator
MSQARAIATRKKLLDATVEVLVERGYSGATTAAVCRQAEVSRGTLLYHFKTRTDLLLAALEHVLAERIRTFVMERRDGPSEPAALIRQMWPQWQGPALTAWLELAVAARTDRELGARMRVVMLEFDDMVRAAFRELLGTTEVPDAAPFLVFAVLNGLAVGRSYEEEGHEQPVLALLEQLATNLLGGETP